MKLAHCIAVGLTAAALGAAAPDVSTGGISTQMVVTVRNGALASGDLTVQEVKTPLRV